jgi:serine/threonine-protein kinase
VKRCADCAAIENDDAEACASCGAKSWAPEPPMVVDARYEVTRKLGRGAMGIVYLAKDRGLGRDVALKTISPMYARDASAVDRFQREARALATIRNDHVVQVYAFGQHARSFYFAMEYVEGTSLHQVLETYAAHDVCLPLDRTITLLRQIGLGLGAAHERGLVHRDVKPSNILVEQDTGRPVVIDFGLVHAPNRAENAHTMRSGTPSYMAPEQSSGPVVDASTLTPRTDVYALACTAFEVLTGEPPFRSGDVAELWRLHQGAPAPLLSSLRADLAELDPVLARALEKDASARYATCESFTHAFEKAAASVLGGAVAPAVPRPGGAPTSSVMGAHVRVLVVDDGNARDAAAAAAPALSGGRVSTTTDGASTATAARAALRKQPDVIVLSSESLGPDLLPLLAAIRDDRDGARARVVIAGANGPAAERWRFAAYGVRDFVDALTADALEEAFRTLGLRAGWAG